MTGVNLNTRQVVHVENTGSAPLPPGAEYREGLLPSSREPPRPLTLRQPEGPSFVVEGHLVKWQNWSFRWSFLPREGLCPAVPTGSHLRTATWSSGTR